MTEREFQVFRCAGASNDHHADRIVVSLSGVTVSFTAVPFAAVVGTAVNGASPARPA